MSPSGRGTFVPLGRELFPTEYRTGILYGRYAFANLADNLVAPFFTLLQVIALGGKVWAPLDATGQFKLLLLPKP